VIVIGVLAGRKTRALWAIILYIVYRTGTVI